MNKGWAWYLWRVEEDHYVISSFAEFGDYTAVAAGSFDAMDAAMRLMGSP